MCRVHDAIEDGVGEGRVVELRVPAVTRQLAGDQGRARADAIVEQFEQVVALGRSDRSDGEVVEDQQVDARQLRQAPTEAAVAVGDAQFLEQARGAHVEHREAATARPAAPSAQASQVLPTPVAPVIRTLWPWRSQSPPASALISVRSRLRELRQSMSSMQALETLSLAALSRRVEALGVAPVDLALHEHAPAVPRSPGSAAAVLSGLVLQRVDHAVQAQAAQLVEGVFVEQRVSFSGVSGSTSGRARCRARAGAGGGRRRQRGWRSRPLARIEVTLR